MKKNTFLNTIAISLLLVGTYSCGGNSSEDIPEELKSYGGEIEFTHISVPQNYEDPDGKQIEIAVGILKAPHPQTGTLPLLILSGGPGDSAIVFFSNASLTNNFINMAREHRDVILLDQRGTGYSEPALFCSSGEDVSACRNRLTNDGADLALFNTNTATKDIEVVLNKMDLPVVDVYGVSYGTFLAQNIMRELPSRVRSVVLDSTLPLTMEISRAKEAGRVVQDAFDALFADCQATAPCHSSFPHLKDSFDGLLARAKVTPLSITVTQQSGGTKTYSLSDVDLLGAFETLLVLKSVVPNIPAAVDALYRGESSSPAIDAVFGVSTTSNSKTTASGDFRSVFCRDQAAFTPLEEVLGEDATLDPSFVTYSDTLAQQIYNACEIWSAGRAPESLRQPLVSEIPTLILAGELDTKTAPEWGRIVGETLPNSHYFRLPRTGHGTIQQDCAQSLIAEFLDNPLQEPDDSCMAQFYSTDYYVTAED